MVIFGYVLFGLSVLSFGILSILFALSFQRTFKPLIPFHIYFALLIFFLVSTTILLSATSQVLIRV